jgi:hypothetical protein
VSYGIRTPSGSPACNSLILRLLYGRFGVNYYAMTKVCNGCQEEKDINSFAFKFSDRCIRRGTCNQCRYKKRKKKPLDQETKIKYNAAKLARFRERYQTDLLFKLKHDLRQRMYKALNGSQKSSTTQSLLGCSVEEFKTYIESLWLEGMTWENRGPFGWHIDHIDPCDYFDLSDPQQQKKCFHYTNLQPLWWRDNLVKGKKVKA